VKALLTVMMAGVLLGGVFADRAEAGDRGHGRRGHSNARNYRDDYRAYARPRNVVVVRNYYRPYYRPAPRVTYRYYRGGYLPPGWRTRVVPVPVYLEPEFVPVPYGYTRGFIDGHAVVYNKSGFILDIAAVF
jgi:Ni/Co efflux regulator RcnB